MEDTRNLIDEYKGLSNEQIFYTLEKTRNPLEIAIENVEHDFNIGSIVRTANSFNVKKVHVIGKKKYNRRGAMCTDKYLEILHHPTLADFLATQENRELVAIENNTPRAEELHKKKFEQNTTLIFGSTRSVNVGAAAAIAMYEFTRQNIL